MVIKSARGDYDRGMADALASLGGRRIGPHLPLGRGMVKGAARAAEVGATAIQIFSDNPTAWRRRSEPPAELPTFRQRLSELDITPLAIHGPYLVNLAGADDDFWSRSVATLINDLRMASLYGAAFVNVHIGSHRGAGRAAGTKRVADGLASVLAETPEPAPRLILENSAGGGDGLGGTMEELEEILEASAVAGVDARRIGFCLDTAHLWGAGFDVSRPDVIDQVLTDFDARLGPEQLAMLHLNDSRSPLGSHTDRHEHIGAGLIGRDGMRAFLCHPRLSSVPTFVETPGMDEGYDAVNMERVRLLIAGRDLPHLPAEAFAFKGRTRGAHPGEDPAEAAEHRVTP
jgi:deoxyribonuclease-4